MIDVSVKLYCKVKPKSSICFHRHLYERDVARTLLVPRQRCILHAGTKQEAQMRIKVNGLNKFREEV